MKIKTTKIIEVEEEVDFSSFPQNKYTKWYINLIDSRRFQEKIKFKTESHHIFPVSLFGKNKFTVNLTHREQFIAHLILWKMYKSLYGHGKMSFALHSMSTLSSKDNKREIYKMNSHLFEKMKDAWKIENGKRTKDRWDNDHEYRDAITKSNQEYWSNEENRQAQSERRKEYFKDDANKEKHSDLMKEVCNTDEWRKQRSDKQKELSSDSEYTKKRIDAMNTAEARKKSSNTIKMNNSKLTKEERSKKYSRPKTKEQLKDHSEKLKGNKRVVNLKTGEIRNAQGERLDSYLSQGFVFWNDLTQGQKQNLK